MSSSKEGFAGTHPSNRVLLLPHCLRKADLCKGKYSRQGLECAACQPDCAVNRLRQKALALGYKGVCVAPGGVLAMRYIQEIKPEGVAAVACKKELKEGIRAVKKLGLLRQPAMPVFVVPLSKDGCVDTEVDVDEVERALSLGCDDVEGAKSSG